MTANNLPETVTAAIDSYYARGGVDNTVRPELESAIADAISAAASRAANEARKEAYEDQKYNGWSSYATWRVNLGILDEYLCYVAQDIEAGYQDRYDDVYSLSQYLSEYTSDVVTGDLAGDKVPDLAASYAESFLSDVNYYEIAEHFADSYPQCLNDSARFYEISDSAGDTILESLTPDEYADWLKENDPADFVIAVTDGNGVEVKPDTES